MDALARGERGVECRRQLGLDPDHASASGSRHRDSRDEPAAADRHDDRLDVGAVLEDLEPDRSLAGDRERIVEWMHERPAGLLEQHVETLERLARIGRVEVDCRAVPARRGDLRLARAAPHDDERVDPLLRRAPRGRLRVVSGRDRDDAALLLLRRERGELREHAARLERARALEELGLEEDVLAERAAREHRRPEQPAGDDPSRTLDVAPLDHRAIVGERGLAAVGLYPSGRDMPWGQVRDLTPEVADMGMSRV